MPIDSNAPPPLLHPHERAAFDFAFASGNIRTVLDIGCGTGRTTGILADEYAMTVTAFDIDRNAIEIARSHYPNLDFSVFDAQDMSRLPDNSFDAAIFSANGIGLIPTQEGRHKCLAEITRVLRGGGMLIYSRHSFHGLFRRRVAKLMLWQNLEPCCAERPISIMSTNWEIRSQYPTAHPLVSAEI